MLHAVIKKELLGHLVSFRFLVSTTIMLVLAALAASVGTRDYSLRRSLHEARLAKHSESLEAVHVYSHLHPRVARAPEPLSVLHRGFDARLGTEVQLDVFRVPVAASGESADELGQSFRDLDLTTIVRVVLGLLALLLTFDTVIGERERSTLMLILANGISRSTLVAGKYLGAFFALLLPLLAGSVVSLWILLDRGGVVLGAQRWQRLAGLLLAYLAYLSVMLLLGLLLSTAARTTSSALVYSLLSWLAIVFLVPQSAIAIADVDQARNIGPPAVRKVTELVTERDEKLAKIAGWSSIPRIHHAPVVEWAAARGVLYRFGYAVFYQAKADYHAKETAIGMSYAERIFELEQRIDGQSRRSESLAIALASPSPAFLMERIAASYAGTSVDDHDGFLEDCRELRRRFIEYLERRQAFSSWRWFTDDRPGNLQPWPLLLGVAPETVDEAQGRGLMQRFQGAETQHRVRQAKESFRADPARHLKLHDLPALRRTSPGFWGACRRVSVEIVLLLSANGLLAAAAWWRFAGYPPA